MMIFRGTDSIGHLRCDYRYSQ